MCPNAVFFPEIAITQMRCWPEGRRVLPYACIQTGNFVFLLYYFKSVI